MSIQDTLQERGNRYGDFTDHAALCQQLVSTMQTFKPAMTPAGADPKWNLLSHVQRQALTVIADKIARILSGDPNYADNWHDIQGYAKLVEDRLPVTAEAAPANDNAKPAVKKCGHQICGGPGFLHTPGCGINNG